MTLNAYGKSNTINVLNVPTIKAAVSDIIITNKKSVIKE